MQKCNFHPFFFWWNLKNYFIICKLFLIINKKSMIKVLLFKSNICEYLVQYKLCNDLTIGYILYKILWGLREEKEENRIINNVKRHKNASPLPATT